MALFSVFYSPRWKIVCMACMKKIFVENRWKIIELQLHCFFVINKIGFFIFFSAVFIIREKAFFLSQHIRSAINIKCTTSNNTMKWKINFPSFSVRFLFGKDGKWGFFFCLVEKEQRKVHLQTPLCWLGSIIGRTREKWGNFGCLWWWRNCRLIARINWWNFILKKLQSLSILA